VVLLPLNQWCTPPPTLQVSNCRTLLCAMSLVQLFLVQKLLNDFPALFPDTVIIYLQFQWPQLSSLSLSFYVNNQFRDHWDNPLLSHCAMWGQ
jgi:hypothetical protein